MRGGRGPRGPSPPPPGPPASHPAADHAGRRRRALVDGDHLLDLPAFLALANAHLERGTGADLLEARMPASALAWRNTSPVPSASSTKPNPFSGLYHFTAALSDGVVEGVENDGNTGGEGVLP